MRQLGRGHQGHRWLRARCCHHWQVPLAVAVCVASSAGGIAAAFAGHWPARALDGRGSHSRLAIARRAALTAGDTVLVLGGGGPLAQITVSMLKGLGYIPRPACNEKLVDMWKNQGVAAYVFGGAEPLPAAAGLLCASEAPLQPQVVCACVRRLFGESPVAKRDAAEAEVLEACKDAGVEWTVVRVGRLRGGGTGTGSVHCLPRAFYDSFAEDGLLGPTAGMEEEIFDLQQRGLRVCDVDGGPLGLDMPTAGRILAATALSSSLGLAEAAGKRLGVASEVAEKGPSEDEWASAFRAQG